MEYTVQKLGKMAGISARTLRYYDEIEILKPARVSSSGYRIYGEKEVNILQQILFYREMGVSLEDIKKIITSPSFDESLALKEHRQKLLVKREQIDLLIENVNKTIDSLEGRIKMNSKEKFEGFKQKMIQENEEKYGEEIREKYGDEAVDKSNKKMEYMTEDQYGEFEKLGEEVIQTLVAAYANGDASSELAQKAADLHRQWLCFSWDSYSKEAHASLAQMYVDDERFKAFYDKYKPGLAEFLRDAVLIYTGVK